MSKFFINPSAVEGKYIYLRDKNDLHHLTRVLRARIGDKLDISDGTKWEYKTEIEAISQDSAKLAILDKQAFAREPNTRITLYQGVPKAAKMETIIQKNVEMGVFEIAPVFMERTVVADKGNASKKLERWQKIASEASKQCKRGIIPEVREALNFDSMYEELKTFDLVLFPYENEEKETMKDCLRKLLEDVASGNKQKPENVAVIIGPEGGFSDKEAKILADSGACSVSLGSTILRTETAGIAAIAMVMYELEL